MDYSVCKINSMVSSAIWEHEWILIALGEAQENMLLIANHEHCRVDSTLQ